MARKNQKQTTVVVDTSVLMACPQVFEVPELRALKKVEFVVPATVLWELDNLMHSTERRDRARAALHVLRGFVDRGAATSSVSCGQGLRLRIGGAVEETSEDPRLDLALADDRILAACLSPESVKQSVVLATTEFALYAKALSLGVGAVLLDSYVDAVADVTRREAASFKSAWSRIERADSAWAICRRGLLFLNLPVVRRLLEPLRVANISPEDEKGVEVKRYLAQFIRLQELWVADVDLHSILKEAFGVDPPTAVNYSVQLIWEPAVPWGLGTPEDQGLPSRRRESEQERAIRIQSQERAHREREDFVVDLILSRLETIREYLTERSDEVLL